MISRLKKIITESDLKPEEQKGLLAALKPLPIGEIDELSDFLDKHPEWVVKLYENYEAKKAAGASTDLSKWRDIINKEKKDLEETFK